MDRSGGRFRSLGDGQVDFKTIFSKLTQYDYSGWAVMEWECCIKHPEDGAREGAHFIKRISSVLQKKPLMILPDSQVMKSLTEEF
jgi:sugar phosphate isomerase/epimerase